MKGEKISWGLVVGSTLLQWYFMYSADIFEQGLPFSTGLVAADMVGGNMTTVLYSIIPIPFVLWLFSGRMEAILRGYGKLYIIRNYSRQRMVLKEICGMMLSVIGIQCIAWTVFHFFRNGAWIPLTTAEQIKVMVMCVLTLIGTVLLQYCLELILQQAPAQIVTLIYYTASLSAYGLAKETTGLTVMRGIFFPNLAFGLRNGALEAGCSELFIYSVIEILVICILLIHISLIIVNKKDIM